MTREEEDLLLKDLCARLPYGVIVNVNGFDYDYNDKLTQIYNGYGCSIQVTTNMSYDIEQVKPYLFPFSSMTDEQLFEVQEILGKNEIKIEGGFLSIVDSDRNTISYLEILTLLEWFYKNHFDIYGLIEKSLAIDCTNLDIY